MTRLRPSGILYFMDNQIELSTSGQPDWLIVSPDLRDDGPLRPLFKKQLQRWELVLLARAIPFRGEPYERGKLLLVPAEHYARAKEELRLFEQENHNWPPPPPDESPQHDNLLPTLSVLIAIAAFHNLCQLDISLAGHNPVDWVGLGNADAGKILRGDWWRLLTSLTLHADLIHLLGNMAIGGVFMVRICRDLGAGLGWSLVLASGILGNLVNALLQHPDHRAVGASTAVFGAVGLLAAISLLRYRLNLRRRWPIPIAAALALLALLGSSGERTDLGAHLFGFACGFGLGLGAEYLLGRFGRPGPWRNRLLSVGTAALMLFAWYAALSI